MQQDQNSKLIIDCHYHTIKKRDELTSAKCYKYFTQVTGAQIFAKHNLQLSNLNLTMKSASLSSAILSFFLVMAYICILQKIVAQRGRLQLFCTFAVILVKYSAPTSSNFFLCKIWVITNS